MKIEYIKNIHKEEGKPDRLRFTIVNGDHLLQYCCDKSKDASEKGFFEVAYNKNERSDISWDNRHDENVQQDKPLICMLSRDEGDCDDSGERKLYPIDKCPFCGKDNEIILVKTKEIIHIVTKRIIPAHEIDENTTQEKIIFDSTDKTQKEST